MHQIRIAFFAGKSRPFPGEDPGVRAILDRRSWRGHAEETRAARSLQKISRRAFFCAPTMRRHRAEARNTSSATPRAALHAQMAREPRITSSRSRTNRDHRLHLDWPVGLVTGCRRSGRVCDPHLARCPIRCSSIGVAVTAASRMRRESSGRCAIWSRGRWLTPVWNNSDGPALRFASRSPPDPRRTGSTTLAGRAGCDEARVTITPPRSRWCPAPRRPGSVQRLLAGPSRIVRQPSSDTRGPGLD